MPRLKIRPNKIALKLFHKLAKYLVGPLASRAIAEAVFQESVRDLSLITGMGGGLQNGRGEGMSCEVLPL